MGIEIYPKEEKRNKMIKEIENKIEEKKEKEEEKDKLKKEVHDLKNELGELSNKVETHNDDEQGDVKMEGLPKKINDNIFNKFISFFRKIFWRKNKTSEVENKYVIENTDTKEEFKMRLQKEVKENNKKEEIIRKIEENPNIIYELSDERLSQLLELYDEKILKLDNDILELNNQLKRLKQNQNKSTK